MPIEKRKCQCGCGRTFLGTAQRKFYNGSCKQKAYRARVKSWNAMSDLEKRDQFKSECG